MITGSGREVWPDTWREVGRGGCPSLFDIGNGLSRMPRFAGQTKIWYPVLAHVLTVADLLPPEIAVYGLLHDAGESIVGDQVSTWKNAMTSADENVLLERISLEHGIHWPWPQDIWEQVKWADHVCLRAEAEVLAHFQPDHPSFTKYESNDLATRKTEWRAMIPIKLWTGWGYGGELYERAVRAAMTPRIQV